MPTRFYIRALNAQRWASSTLNALCARGRASVKEVAIVGPEPSASELARVVRGAYRPHLVLAAAGAPDGVPLLEGRDQGVNYVTNPVLRGYDQGFVLRKRGPAKSSPWICAPGPGAVLMLVHCSLAKLAGPRSVHRLAEHMAAYGIVVDHRKIDSNELGSQLRMLGLVLDSPDAESGMLLVPPFAGVSA